MTLNVRPRLEKSLGKAGIEIRDDMCGCWIAAHGSRRVAGPSRDRMAVVVDAVGWLANHGHNEDICGEIYEERTRQIVVEGFTIQHDAEHDDPELILAAMAYCHAASALEDTSRVAHKPPTYWPLDANWWKPKNRRRDLIRAAALIVAAIDKGDRAVKRRNVS